VSKIDRAPRFVPAVLTAALGASVLAAAQQPPPAQDPQKPPVFRAEANFVRVDVYPLSDGRPVLDLTAADFQVFEDGVPQAIATFEHVLIEAGGPQTARIEPNTIEQSRQAAANPRNRVFVLFLDTNHVSIDGAWHSREPLIRMVDSILGDDDLVGIMTPEMSAADITFGRKTAVLADGLRFKDPWGERHRLRQHPREEMYRRCYPWPETQGVVKEMAARRHERTTLDALNELVHYLSGIREDRKAIVTVTEGWLLYRPNPDLTRLRVINPLTGETEPVPKGPDIFVGPDGKLRLGGANPGAFQDADKSECDRERVYLSQMNNWDYVREIMDDANRWNASFYTIDPRGLPVFDTPIGPDPPPPPHVQFDMVRQRHDAMRILADNTDGLAIMNSNDLDAGLKRISDDLTSYYLIGYYTTNTAHDGKFRSIDVKVSRPGVEVRARRGYRAATEDEVRGAKAAAAPAIPPEVAAVQAAMAGLARLRSETAFRVHAAPAPGGDQPVIWVAGERQSVPGRPAATDAATVEIQVSGAASGSARVSLDTGQRAFLAPVVLDRPFDAGSVEVRARIAGGTLIDTARVDAGTWIALLSRRGASTGNRWEPAGAPQFSRTERLRLEVPAGVTEAAGEGRVLDRNGQPLGVPVVMGERTDQRGTRWLTAEMVLAPLAPGDYVVDLRPGDRRVITAIRVTR
jgi:VWFA-related protein